MFKSKEKIQLILFSILIIMLSCSYIINYALAKDPYFIQSPQIISKTMTQKENAIMLSITIRFIASGFDNEPINAYLTTSGITSDNLICFNQATNGKIEPALISGPAQGENIRIDPSGGKIIFSNNLPPITDKMSQTICPGDVSPDIRSATLKDVQLHLVQEDGIKRLVFKFEIRTCPWHLSIQHPN